MAPTQGRHKADGSRRGAKERLLALKPSFKTTKRRQLEADLAHVNQEIYRRNLELHQTNKMLALLEAIDKLVLESDMPLKPLCMQLAERVMLGTESPFVAILGHMGAHADKVEMYGWATNSLAIPMADSFIQTLTLRTDSPWFHGRDSIKFINLEAVDDAYIARFCERSPEEVQAIRQQLNFQTATCIKLTVRRRLVGLMIIGGNELQRQPDDFTQALYMRLAEATGIAIDHKMLFEENQRVLEQLEETNSKLKVLDRAKDEFISMASHQLRTPLTSVKGYISMVLEGDVGAVSESQKKLLTEAFSSAQRMVYLIGDFLNVSRLQTGKFVLEPKPANLATMVEEEIGQLLATAARREITINYKKPEHFPTLTIDETKIRQVIMNFIDNAIFYSKPHSTVEVHLVSTDKDVRFEVVDHGIGVPEAERHKLFAKFYRASNAREARPDGTGIGLFMAKKVVVAHQGTIIFETEENVGSTFGFSLPLNLENPAK